MFLGTGGTQLSGGRREDDPPAPIPSYDRLSSVLVADDSSYIAFPGIARLPDDSLLVVVRSGTSHFLNGNLVKYTGNSTGSSWSGPTTVIDNSNDLRDVELVKLANDDLLCTYTERSNIETAEDFVPKVIKSTDDGATWGSPVTITHGFTGWGFITSKIVELTPGGDLLAPIYGLDSGGVSGSTDYCRLSKSTDGGATWSAFSTIVASGTSSKAWSEPQVALRSNGDLVCAIRRDSGADTYLSTSTDDGATWSAPALIHDGGGRPSIIETPDDALMLVARTDAYPTDPIVRWSFDDGATWASFNLGAIWPFVYGSWIVLASGNVGLVWCVEDNSDFTADMYFDSFEYVEI